MLTALVWLPFAQALAIAPLPQEPALLASVPAIEGQALPRIPNEVTRFQEVRPLPGQLDETPVFNSNSPEVIQQDGILLSTFPGDQMANSSAHLDYAFDGRFDFFAHHIARGVAYDDRRTLFVGGVVYNPNSEPVTLEILQGVSYLSQEAPFRDLPSIRFNPDGDVFAGPGSRTVTDFLMGRRQLQWPRRITIPPERAYLLMNAPIPLRRLPFSADATLPPGSVLPGQISNYTDDPVASIAPTSGGRPLPSNGRSLLLHLSSDAPVYAATLAMYAPRTLQGQERAPTLQEWLLLLVNGDLAGPRDIPPTDPEGYDNQGRFFYGRVAGVARGSQWEAVLEDEPAVNRLTIPEPGDAVSYVLSTVDHNTFGTEQIQSAPMLARYSDTAYRAHGNYGIHYRIKLPLYNDSSADQAVILRLQTPLQDETILYGLRFLRNPADRIFFRGTMRISYQSDSGQEQTRYMHVVQRQGEEGEPILRLNLPPDARRDVTVEFIYPPDATPPQVLTIATSGIANGRSSIPVEGESNQVIELNPEEQGPVESPEVPAQDVETTAPLPPQDSETDANEDTDTSDRPNNRRMGEVAP
ncbi:DUF3370 domain-containing protein [Oscillatoria sp. CS-180]|uniref:DUF3370 domain-containing protein n=1 Tax=Oscillatoria sp. CS-180 TaxID=3021720 RepID=UPI00232BB47C|nr:DUF3370 domain-containing protein [Oscillatoria sp. CS-180]MDB9525249.1 DUF3370 domain-containing protein [Oscillatoria sp. CS-180]